MFSGIAASVELKLGLRWAKLQISDARCRESNEHTFVCQIVKVVRVRVANNCPLLVTRIATISPCTSSSANCPGVCACDSVCPLFSASAPSPSSIDVSSSSVLSADPVSDAPWRPLCVARSVPSWDIGVRSRFVFLVAAKTEGEEMGQYVMAVYGQSKAAFARAHLTVGCEIIHDTRVGGAAGSRWLCGIHRTRKAQHSPSFIHCELNNAHGYIDWT